MLTEVGRVVAVDSDALWVETIRRSTCGTCAAQKGCGHGILNRITDGKRSYIRVLSGAPGSGDCQVDDQVLISLPEEVFLRGSFIAYVLPLLCMLGGALAATEIISGNQDALAALGAVGGLALGFGLVRLHAVTHRNDPGFQPILLRVLQPGTESVQLV